MESAMRFRTDRGIQGAAVLVLLAAACGKDADSDIVLVQGQLGTEPGCFSGSAHTVLTGGGKFVTNDTYSRSGCGNGYLVDINDYDTTYNLGTTVSYASEPPTNQVDCERTHMQTF